MGVGVEFASLIDELAVSLHRIKTGLAPEREYQAGLGIMIRPRVSYSLYHPTNTNRAQFFKMSCIRTELEETHYGAKNNAVY